MIQQKSKSNLEDIFAHQGFHAPLFTTAEAWKQPKCPMMGE